MEVSQKVINKILVSSFSNQLENAQIKTSVHMANQHRMQFNLRFNYFKYIDKQNPFFNNSEK